MNHERKSFKFGCKGLQLTRPVDLLDALKYPFLQNVRSYVEGVIQPRPGMTAINSSAVGSPTAIHSVKRLNDDIPSASQAFARYIGAGTVLYSDNAAHNAFASRDTGYSGDPLSFVAARPEGSPEPWVYIADANKLKKGKVDGTVYGWGVAPPNVAPTYTLASRNYKVVNLFDDTTSWTNGGTAGAVSLLVGRRVDTTIANILYDSGSTGWALVNPTTLTAQLQPGMFITAGGSTETVLIEEVHDAIPSTTIASIQYDSGTSGLCTISLTSPSATLVPNAMIRIAAAENVRVLSVTLGPDGIPSFRCSTTATRAAGDAIAGLASFRVYFANTHAAADALTAEAFSTTVTTGVGYISLMGALDLSVINSRPLGEDDEIVISFRVDSPASVTELKFLLDVDSATNDFTRNYYYFTVRPSDLTSALNNTITDLAARQRIIQRAQVAEQQLHLQQRQMSGPSPHQMLGLDPVGLIGAYERLDGAVNDDPFTPDLPADQLAPGDSAWTTVRVKISDLLQNRVGTDSSRSLKDVAAIRVQATTTASVVLNVDSWWVGGTYGPDSDGYLWRYRYRSSTTDAKSLWSPPMRSPVEARRVRVVLTPTTSGDAQVDKIDWQRIGGALLDWTYVATTPNSGTFTDDFPDFEIMGRERLTEDDYQPFPVPDIPRTGTCDVRGTEITRVSGDTFNTSWARGSQIIINGVPYGLYNSPTSTSRISLEQNAGTQTGATFYLPEATILGQPLPVAWGPIGGGETGEFIFSCQYGTLRWTNGNSPDSARDSNSLEITSGSETLMNGCVYDGFAFLWSNERMFRIFGPAAGLSPFYVQEVANSAGLFARWFFCVGREGIFYGSKDGIYFSEGGQAVSITDEDLYPLFPHDGQAGITVNGIVPPDYAQVSKLRLAYADGFLYFDFQDTGGNLRTLVCDVKNKAWYYDKYTPTILKHYGEEGKGIHSLLLCGNDGKLYQSSGVADGASAIDFQIRTPSMDCSDSRARKLFSEVLTDVDPNNATVSVQPGFDNHTSTVTATTITGATRAQTVIDLTSGAGQLARNLSLDITWSSSTATPKLYEWQPSYLPRPEDTQKRFTDYTDDGRQGVKFLQGCLIDCDTGGVAKTVVIQGDGGVTIATLTVNHNGRLSKIYTWTPAYTHQMRLAPTTTASLMLFGVEWKYQEFAEFAQLIPDFSDLGEPGDKRIMGVTIEADTTSSSSSNAVLNIYKDGDASTVVQALTITHAGRRELTYELTPFVAGTLKISPAEDLRFFNAKWIYEKYPENSALLPDYSDLGYKGAKLIRGVAIEADTLGAAVSVLVQRDNGITVDTLSVNHAVKQISVYPLDPTIAAEVRLLPQADWRFFGVRWIYDEQPELSQITTAWTDAGYQGAKFLQGLVLEADSSGEDVSVQVQYDDETVGAILSCNHSTRVSKPYSFVPFIGHNFRLVPLGDIRIYGVKFVFEPAPELTSNWTTPVTTHGLNGFFHLRDGFITHTSTANLTLRVIVDGESYSYTITHGNGVQKKSYVVFRPVKGKTVKYALTSESPFRLYQQDAEVRAKEWGSTSGYQTLKPFGDLNMINGARI